MPGISNVTATIGRLTLRTAARQVVRNPLGQSLTRGRTSTPLLTEGYNALGHQTARMVHTAPRFVASSEAAAGSGKTSLLRIAAAAFGAAAVLGASARRRVDAAPPTPEVLLEVAEKGHHQVQTQADVASGPEAILSHRRAVGAGVALCAVRTAAGGGSEGIWEALEKALEEAKEALQRAEKALLEAQGEARQEAEKEVQAARCFLEGVEAVQAAMVDWQKTQVEIAADGVVKKAMEEHTSGPQAGSHKTYATLRGAQAGDRAVRGVLASGGGPGAALLAVERVELEALTAFRDSAREFKEAKNLLEAMELAATGGGLTLEQMLVVNDEESVSAQAVVKKEAQTKAKVDGEFWCGVEKVVQAVRAVIVSFNAPVEAEVEGAVGGDGACGGEEPSTSQAVMPQQD